VSGWKGKNREGALGELLKVLQEGDYLLVEDLDRLSRENPLSAMNLLQSIVLKGVTVVSLRDNNTVTKENFYSLPTFLPSILKASLAYEENEKKSMRIKESWVARRTAIAKGTYINGRIPFWCKLQDGKLVLIEEKANIIRQIFDMAYSGMGFYGIVNRLTADQITLTKAKWNIGNVGGLLRNIHLYGAIQMHIMENRKRIPVGEPIEGYFPTVISKDRFLAVQAKVASRKNRGGRGQDAVSNLFSGILKCSQCGASIVFTNKSISNDGYLLCSSYHFNGNCTSSIMNYKWFEIAMLGYIQKDAHLIQCFSADAIQPIQQQIDEKQAMLDTLTKKIDALTDMAEKGGAPEPIIVRLRERMAEQKLLKDELQAMESQKYAETNQSNLCNVSDQIQRQWGVIMPGSKVTFYKKHSKGNITQEVESVMFEDRLAIREAFRNTVQSMGLDLSSKKGTIIWKSGATSKIEIMLKRQGRRKAAYYYRAKTNGNPVSDWVLIGAII
jgi:DNA invertase Pin-like site-specific DNA recombinase